MSDTSNVKTTVVRDSDQLLQLVQECISGASAPARIVIAIAGPPASGKSTLSSQLVERLQALFGADRVVGIPMDGFHLDNVQLDLASTRAIKGAPQTFDIGGLVSLVQRLRTAETPIYAPEFDRTNDMSRNCAIQIDNTHDIVVIEGNYLLLDKSGWRELRSLFDMTINIDVPDAALQTRLVQRWLNHGLTAEAALARAQSNDIPNAEVVRKYSSAADIAYRPENS